MSLLRWLPLVLALAATAACGDDSGGGDTQPMFSLDANTPETFYELPFPNDLRRTETGLDLSAFPSNALVVTAIRDAAQELDGFGLNSAMYMRFTGGLDQASLPTVETSRMDDASVYVVDIDADSPTYGERWPIIATYRAEGSQTIVGDQLVVRPFPGFPLAEGTTFALVVTTRVKDAGGSSIGVAPTFADIVSDNAPAAVAKAREVYAPLLDYLDEAGGDDRKDVASAAVFTTQHATNVAAALRAGVFAQPAPVAAGITSPSMNATFQRFDGTYMAPNFQEGDVPYTNSPAGRISVENGVAVMRRMEPMRFALTVPAGPVPANGWPICIYAHGTGGSFQSFVGDGTASALAKQGIAVISTDQVLHGPRNPGGNEELDFFNFGNPYAARDNATQGFADAWSQMRLALGMSFTDTGRTHTFDETKVFFFGHSQGGNTGPGFVAFEPSLKGAVMSGTAGALYLNLLYKTKPLDIPALVQTFIRDEPLDEDNPSIALAQLWIERSDSVNYAPLMVRTPATVDGTQLAPRNIYQTEGFIDTYAPNIGIEAFATALGGDIVVTPNVMPVKGLELRGRTMKPVPFMDNLNGATAVLAQFNKAAGSDGHFVVFDIPLAEYQAAVFLGSISATGHASVVPLP